MHILVFSIHIEFKYFIYEILINNSNPIFMDTLQLPILKFQWITSFEKTFSETRISTQGFNAVSFDVFLKSIVTTNLWKVPIRATAVIVHLI